MATVHIGSLRRSRVELDVRQRENPDAHEYWDANWLAVGITVEMGAWQGRYEASLHVEEFERFLEQVRSLRTDLSGTAEFHSMEGYITLRLKGDGLGHLTVQGEARDGPVGGTKLAFGGSDQTFLPGLDLDQTFLPGLVEELEAVLLEFPVRGERPG